MSQLKMPPQLTFSGKAEANLKKPFYAGSGHQQKWTVMGFFFSCILNQSTSQTLETYFTLHDINQRKTSEGERFGFGFGRMKMQTEAPAFSIRGDNVVPWWTAIHWLGSEIITIEHETDQLYQSIVICKTEENTQTGLWNLWRLCPVLCRYQIMTTMIRRSNTEGHAERKNWILRKQNVTIQRLWRTLWAKIVQHLIKGYKNTCGLYYLLVAAVSIGWTGGQRASGMKEKYIKLELKLYID